MSSNSHSVEQSALIDSFQVLRVTPLNSPTKKPPFGELPLSPSKAKRSSLLMHGRGGTWNPNSTSLISEIQNQPPLDSDLLSKFHKVKI